MKSLKTAELTVAICLIAWGAVLLFIGVYFTVSLLSAVNQQFKNMPAHVSLPFGFLTYMGCMFIVAMLTVIAGLLLLTGKKAGWAMCVSLLLLYTGFIIVFYCKAGLVISKSPIPVIIGVLFMFWWLTLLYILLLKPLRVKYTVSNFTYLAVIVVVTLVITAVSVFA